MEQTTVHRATAVNSTFHLKTNIVVCPLRGQMSDMSVTLNSVTDICPLKKLTTVFTVQAQFSQLCL